MLLFTSYYPATPSIYQEFSDTADVSVKKGRMPADRADLPPVTPKVHLEVYEGRMLPRDDPLKKAWNLTTGNLVLE